MRLLPLLLLAACEPLALDAPEPYAWVVYDPSGGDIPLPNDLVRDAAAGRLNLPLDGEGLTDADRDLRAFLGTLPAWPPGFAITVAFSEPVDPASLTEDTVRVLVAGGAVVPGLLRLLDADGTTLTVDPPVGGWTAGERYAVVVRGGPDGVRTTSGLPLGPDAAMWFLRQDARLDEPARQRAFPGATREERLEVAATLEIERQRLAPWFDIVGLDRDGIAALWDFSVHDLTQLAMDRETQQVPVPFDVLIDPATGLVDLEPAPWDTPLETDAKLVANTFDGFGLSSDLLFETTAGLDPSTVSTDTIQVWRVDPPRPVDVDVLVMREDGAEGCDAPPWADDCVHVVLKLAPDEVPLEAATTYAVLVTDGVHDLAGRPLVPMLMGHVLRSAAPVADASGRTLLSGLSDADARRLEGVRRRVDPMLARVDRERVVAAWPFTTMDPMPRLEQSAHLAERLDLSVPPTVRWRRPASSVLQDDAIGELFPGALNPGPALYLGRTTGVKHVVSGVLPGPNFLDPATRRWREPYDVEPLPFWAAVPDGYPAARDLPVLLFGHAIVTDRRFLLTVASELVRRGHVVIGIDFPYHGERVACVESSLVAVPNFFPEELQPLVGFEDELIWLPPCASGDAATCSPTGACLDARGRPEPFNTFPIIDMLPVSGAAFLDTADLPHIPDHFHQALVDLSTLRHSLIAHEAAWEAALGQEIDPRRVAYLGQSLGSIIGAVWLGARTDVNKAVLNVPGSNLVDLFLESIYFRPQIDAYFRDIDVAEGSYEQQRLLAVASWLVDSVDPHSVAHRFAERRYNGLIQMDKVDEETGDLIIPNSTTENLARISGLRVQTYPSVLHADLIVPLVGDQQLRDAAEFLGEVPR